LTNYHDSSLSTQLTIHLGFAGPNDNAMLIFTHRPTLKAVLLDLLHALRHMDLSLFCVLDLRDCSVHVGWTDVNAMRNPHALRSFVSFMEASESDDKV